MFDSEKIELFHGSSVEFSEFNDKSISLDYQAQVVSGVYFTTNTEEAKSYATTLKDREGEQKDGGYIYQVNIGYNCSSGNRLRKIELLNTDSYKNKVFVEVKKSLDGFDVVNKSGVNVTIKRIADLIEQSPDYEMKIADFASDDEVNLDFNDKFAFKKLLYKVADHYYQVYKEKGLIDWINIFSNDFFNTTEDLLRFNKLLSKKLNLAGFIRDDFTPKKLIEDKKEFHVVFLDPDDIPKPIVRTIGKTNNKSGNQYEDFEEYQFKVKKEQDKIIKEQEAYDYFLKSIDINNLESNYKLVEDNNIENYINYLEEVKKQNNKNSNNVKITVLQEWLFNFLKQYKEQKTLFLKKEEKLNNLKRRKFFNRSSQNVDKKSLTDKGLLKNVFVGVYEAFKKTDELYLSENKNDLINWNEYLKNNLEDNIVKFFNKKQENLLLVIKLQAIDFISDVLDRNENVNLSEEVVENLLSRFNGIIEKKYPQYKGENFFDENSFSFLIKLTKELVNEEIGFKEKVELKKSAEDIFNLLTEKYDNSSFNGSWSDFVEKNFNQTFLEVKEREMIKEKVNIENQNIISNTQKFN